jgi:hypothetical protein
MSQNDTYIYGQFVTSCKCIITGIDISHQTNNTEQYLLESSIKQIRETAPETFMKLEREYRPHRKNIIKLCGCMQRDSPQDKEKVSDIAK